MGGIYHSSDPLSCATWHCTLLHNDRARFRVERNVSYGSVNSCHISSFPSPVAIHFGRRVHRKEDYISARNASRGVACKEQVRLPLRVRKTSGNRSIMASNPCPIPRYADDTIQPWFLDWKMW
jgi:hypothetical protein